MQIWLPDAITTTAPAIDRIFYLVLWITGIAFVLVQGTLLWFVIRYRRQPGRRAAYTHGNSLVEIIWTAVPAAILVWLAVESQRVWSHVKGTPPPAEVEVAVVAQQFAWNVHYPGADGAFGRTDLSLVDEVANPIGLDRNDPRAQDDLVTVNQLHLPVGRTVLIHLKSKDVLHSFFVPQFRMKLDAVPGLTGRLWVSATKTGSYEIACAELCGLGHFRMRGYLTVESPEAFTAWLAQTLAEQNA
jgi:cytochrome c oxidase subunit 2